MERKHMPVLVKEVLKFLSPKSKGIYLDCTLGGGGHSQAILEASSPSGKVYGIDCDEEAIAFASRRFASYQDRFELVLLNFRNLKELSDKENFDGALFDLGLSTLQLEQAKRGFSYRLDGPLDMRFDRRNSLTAEGIINEYSQEKLQEIFKNYGEERFARRIASAIVRERAKHRISTTFQLADIIKKNIYGNPFKSQARIFQALRIAVNQELENLKIGLLEIVKRLNRGGRIVVISYHSLEDRIVKETFKDLARLKGWEILTKKAIHPTEKEIRINPKARSAKLRAVEKK
ncbi:MAG: 16S rRNA (cytosine(1402)-N(4))-methyltransferase RsmH [Candidatus Edwardsbacteria bacterium]